MKAVLHETLMSCYQKSFEETKSFEVTGESVVSDQLPDIGLLGDTNVTIVLRSKRTESGLAVLEGDLHACVCYLPDGAAGCCIIELKLPWQAEFESELINDYSVSVGDVRAAKIETRMLNPRKVLVKVLLSAELSVYDKKTVSLYDATEASTMIQTKTTAAECSVIGTVCEKTFAATDEYPIPAGLSNAKVLCKSVQLRVDDVKTLANKLIVKGSVLSDVVLCGEHGVTEQVKFTSGYSLIAETDCENISPDVKANLMVTGAYYEITSNGQILSVEVHGVCQMTSYMKREIRYLSDAYSNFYECRKELKELPVFTESKNGTQRESVNVSLAGRSQISEVLFTSCSVSLPQYKKKTASVTLSVHACVKYENGTLDWVKNAAAVEFKIKDFEHILSVCITDAYSVVNGEEVSVRISAEAVLREERETGLQILCGIEADEECPCCVVRPSVTVVRRGGDVWSLAREFGSTVELIRQYNQLEEDEVPENSLLLIPKQYN